MRIYDYTCLNCGNAESDILVKDKDEVVKCKICNEDMKREFPLVHISIGLSKTPLTDYKPGGGDVKFGKL